MSPIEGVVATLSMVMFVSFLVEGLVEFFLGEPFNQIKKLKPYKWLLMYASGAFGIVLAILYGFDLVATLGVFFGGNVSASLAGKVVTGLALGRGSGYLHDLLARALGERGSLYTLLEGVKGESEESWSDSTDSSGEPDPLSG